MVDRSRAATGPRSGARGRDCDGQSPRPSTESTHTKWQKINEDQVDGGSDRQE